jgi:hypothetical protein
MAQQDSIDSWKIVQVNGRIRQALCSDARPEMNVVASMKEVGIRQDANPIPLEYSRRSSYKVDAGVFLPSWPWLILRFLRRG